MSNNASPPTADETRSFAETALTLGGKSVEEARRTGAIDKADDHVESLFAPQYQTTASPIHRAIWGKGVPIELFQSGDVSVPSDVGTVMEGSLQVVREHRASGTLYDENRKIATPLIARLAEVGYWGLLVDRQYGGTGAQFSAFAPFVTQMATINATVAGLASVHGCIGAVDPLRTFGSAEQKARFLPDLASGKKLSAFALTEPGAGSDLTALRTRAVLQGDRYIVNGEKLFITNVVPGRTIGLVCLIEDRPAVLIVDLPAAEDEHFRLRKYGLYALRHTYNQGIIFRDFAVPAINLLRPSRGDGLTIAYHGLNLGRIALCATAAGNMRLMLAGMLPWARFRKTYGQAIETRELVRRRLARLAGLIVASDALVAWCARLIDEGYRGEMECIIAKIFGSEAQKEAAIELCMKTHGGRAFLHGHLFGDEVHEFLAPCIYEGEGEMLCMAFFKSLVKHHGTQFFEPIGKVLAQRGIKKPNPANPLHAWAMRGPLTNYGKWLVREKLLSKSQPKLPGLPPALATHAQFAIDWLHRAGLEISAVMRKHQLGLMDRQCRMAELSARVQDAIVILCTCLYAHRKGDPIITAATETLCTALTRRLNGGHPSDSYFRAMSSLGAELADGGWKSLLDFQVDDILMPYEQTAAP